MSRTAQPVLCHKLMQSLGCCVQPPGPRAIAMSEVDWSQPTAVFFGNEREGACELLLEVRNGVA